mmetsp:Transcript_17530/g.61618  ORF Transcript_17530/g.61618 Transcript_17530/m.61618 type:complete len:226 (-) Transcript_17530:271-948(-)
MRKLELTPGCRKSCTAAASSVARPSRSSTAAATRGSSMKWPTACSTSAACTLLWYGDGRATSKQYSFSTLRMSADSTSARMGSTSNRPKRSKSSCAMGSSGRPPVSSVKLKMSNVHCSTDESACFTSSVKAAPRSTSVTVNPTGLSRPLRSTREPGVADENRGRSPAPAWPSAPRRKLRPAIAKDASDSCVEKENVCAMVGREFGGEGGRACSSRCTQLAVWSST